MFKRFSNRQLLITLAVLAGLYLLSMAVGGRAERTFRDVVAAVDTAQVNKLLISPAGKEQVQLVKNAGKWNVVLPDGKQAPTSANSVRSALGNLSLLEANQLVSRDEGDWGEYKVDSAGTRIQAFNGEQQLMDIILGNFVFRAVGMNYLRVSGEEDTYLVEGYLDGTFNKAINDWRDKTIMKGSQSDIMMLAFSYPADSSFQLTKDSANQWVLADFTMVDQTKVNAYLSPLISTNGSVFVDRQPLTPTPDFQLGIQTMTQGLIEIKAYPDAEHEYLISSSLNPDTYFSGKEEGLFGKIFVGQRRFLDEEE